MRLRIIQGEDRTDVQVPDEMANATDDQILSYIRETLHRELPPNVTVEKTPEAILVHPKATYG